MKGFWIDLKIVFMGKIKCIQCGTDNSNNSKYCSRCGYELPKAEIESISTLIEKGNTSRKKLSLEKMIGIAVGIGVMIFIQQFFFKSPTYDKMLMDVASELNKHCPFM